MRSDVRLAELVAALSLVIDLGLGQPMEHILRQTIIAMRLGESLNLSDTERASLYYVALLAWVGCGSDSHELAAWFGDDIAFRAAIYDVDLAGLDAFTFLARRVASDRPPLRRVAAAAAFFPKAPRKLGASLTAHCLVTGSFADRIGLGADVREPLLHLFERWDGKGGPKGLRGQEIALSARIVQIADVAVPFHRAGGVDAANAVVRERSASAFDPSIAGLFIKESREILGDLGAVTSWDVVVSAQPALTAPLAAAQLDTALEAIADFTDIKSPYTLGHARGVSQLAAAAAESLGLPADEVVNVRRAALLQDAGRMGVSNAIWDKPAPLTALEMERVRLHAYYVERMLQQPPALARIGALAAQHHERLDGSGYPRGLTASSLSLGARVLAAADVYRALLETRPHRPALEPDAAATTLRNEVKAGRLDGDAVRAVLAAAGHRVRHRREWPGGLTPREVEVLCLIARGLANKDVARRLHLSEKTVGNHVEHIYTKIGSSTRAEASLYAMQHGLLDLAQK